MKSPGPLWKPPASTSTPAANGENAESPKPSSSRLPVLPCSPRQRRLKVTAHPNDLSAVLRKGTFKGLVERFVRGGLHAPSAELQLENMSPAGSEMSVRKVCADWRSLAALRVLAALRKLGGPAVQVSIGGQQVNVSG